MKYRKLPKTGLEISEIGFGCMSLQIGADHNERLLLDAIESGINYFDTADLYDRGANEELVGKAIEGRRKEIILATKVGNQWLPDGTTWRWNPSKEYILSAVDKSLKRLRTDYIDIYQLHGGTIEDNIDEVIEAFEMLQQEGKIRYYGISSIRPNVIKAYCEKSKIVSDMLQYSLLDRRPEEEVLSHLRDHQVGVMVRGALAKGLLAGKTAAPHMNHKEQEVASLQEQLKNLSGSDRSMGQLAIRYVLANRAVTSAVIGIRTFDQLQDALGIMKSSDLGTEEFELLRSSISAHVYSDHR